MSPGARGDYAAAQSVRFESREDVSMSQVDRTHHRRAAAGAAVLALLLGSSLGACSAQPAGESPRSGVTVVQQDDLYRLGVGDVVRVSVWKDAELDATVPVAPDGRISLPLLGDVAAAGRTLGELREALTQAYAAYVTSPAVSVVLQEIGSQKVFVTGEVQQPGVIELAHEMRLMQALAVAGGLTPYAKRDRVVVLRNTGGRQQRLTVSLDAIVGGSRPADDLLLQPGDTIVVP